MKAARFVAPCARYGGGHAEAKRAGPVRGSGSRVETTRLFVVALFHVLAILVLLNALIAIMSNVFNAVEVKYDHDHKLLSL